MPRTVLLGSDKSLQGVTHKEQWEMLLLLEHLSFLVVESINECLFVRLIVNSHVAVTRHVDTVQLVIQCVALLCAQSIVDGDNADTSLLKILDVGFRNISCSSLTTAV